MKRILPVIFSSLCCCFLCTPSALAEEQQTAADVVRSAIQYWREKDSVITATMIVHRPEWERTMSLRSWTKGLDQSLIRFRAPKKDAGTASLKIQNEMWTFSPKIARIIKIPSSMMQQSWMGSDFSYNDLAQDDDIVENYHHQFIKSEIADTLAIESKPREGAPVVWGKEILVIRTNKVLLEHRFYDQDGILIKRLSTLEVGIRGGKPFPVRMRMEKVEEEDHWTEFVHEEVRFGVGIPDSVFSLAQLKNPRDPVIP